MPHFYCDCGDMIDDPDEEYCASCRLGEESFCDFCGAPVDLGEDACEMCQDNLDDEAALLNEEDEEFLRGPFR